MKVGLVLVQVPTAATESVHIAYCHYLYFWCFAFCDRAITTMTMLTSEERENAAGVQKILELCLEAIDTDDKTKFEGLRNFLAPEVVITAPAWVQQGVTLWEMQGTEHVIHQFQKIFIDLQLITLGDSKPLRNLVARGSVVTWENLIAGMALMTRGIEFVPRVGYRQRHTLEFQSGRVYRWIIEDDPSVQNDLIEFYSVV